MMTLTTAPDSTQRRILRMHPHRSRLLRPILLALLALVIVAAGMPVAQVRARTIPPRLRIAPIPAATVAPAQTTAPTETGAAKVTGLQSKAPATITAEAVTSEAVTPAVTTADERAPDALAGYQPSVVVLWNEVMLAAIRSGAPRPTVTARSLYMVHQAMYDAWSLFDPVAMPLILPANLRRPSVEHTAANKAAAVSQAAYQTLMGLYGAYEARSQAFSRLLHTLGYAPVSQPNTSPAGLGLMAAQAVLADRAADGSNAANNYVDVVSATFSELYSAVNSDDPTADNGVFGASFDANHWEPLRVPTGTLVDEFGVPTLDAAITTTFRIQSFLTPQWGAVRPFALTSGDQFRPPAPPQRASDEPYVDALGNQLTNDAAYQMQVDEILQLSATLGDREKVIAEYWADGPRSETPPGHWNAIAHGIAYRDRHTLDEDVKLFFVLNGALFDASIACWDAKRAYDFVRPVTAIRHKYAGQMVQAWAGPNHGTLWIPGALWQPYQDATFVTPAFPEYTSGHSTFSAAAAEVLTEFTGSNAFYDGATVLYNEDFNRDGLPDILGQHVVAAGGNLFEDSPSTPIVLQWDTFQAAADEAGLSRRYGGIHFQDGDLRGRAMGRQIGQQAFAYAQQLWNGTTP
jgi:hypothetical protein